MPEARLHPKVPGSGFRTLGSLPTLYAVRQSHGTTLPKYTEFQALHGNPRSSM